MLTNVETPRIIQGRLLGNRVSRERDFRFGGPLVDGRAGGANIEMCPVAIPDAAVQASRVNRLELQQKWLPSRTQAKRKGHTESSAINCHNIKASSMNLEKETA